MLHLLNTTIIPAGVGRLSVFVEPLAEDDARELLAAGPWVSHIGHESTAQVMSAALGAEVPMDRTPMALPAEGQAATCLVMQVNGRPPEGRILTREELLGLGISWRRMTIQRLRDTAKYLAMGWVKTDDDPDWQSFWGDGVAVCIGITGRIYGTAQVPAAADHVTICTETGVTLRGQFVPLAQAATAAQAAYAWAARFKG